MFEMEESTKELMNGMESDDVVVRARFINKTDGSRAQASVTIGALKSGEALDEINQMDKVIQERNALPEEEKLRKDLEEYYTAYHELLDRILEIHRSIPLTELPDEGTPYWEYRKLPFEHLDTPLSSFGFELEKRFRKRTDPE